MQSLISFMAPALVVVAVVSTLSRRLHGETFRWLFGGLALAGTSILSFLPLWQPPIPPVDNAGHAMWIVGVGFVCYYVCWAALVVLSASWRREGGVKTTTENDWAETLSTAVVATAAFVTPLFLVLGLLSAPALAPQSLSGLMNGFTLSMMLLLCAWAWLIRRVAPVAHPDLLLIVFLACGLCFALSAWWR